MTNFVEPENVYAIVVPSILDVAIAGSVPLIYHLDDVDPTLAPIKPLGRPSHIGIRLDLNAHDQRPRASLAYLGDRESLSGAVNLLSASTVRLRIPFSAASLGKNPHRHDHKSGGP